MNETTNFFSYGASNASNFNCSLNESNRSRFCPFLVGWFERAVPDIDFSSKRPISPILGGRPIVTILADWIPLDGSFDSLTQTKSTRNNCNRNWTSISSRNQFLPFFGCTGSRPQKGSTRSLVDFGGDWYFIHSNFWMWQSLKIFKIIEQSL